MAIAKIVLDIIQQEFSKPEPKWTEKPISKSDFDFMTSECNKASPFDPANKRKELLTKLHRGDAISTSIHSVYGIINIVFENRHQKDEVPYGLWIRIMRLFSEKASAKPFKVFFMANTHLREFPVGGESISPHNINGGYTYHCNKETICIYRAEDATRVLIHELNHACCLDKMENGIDMVEAETEAWAELVYVALLSKGIKRVFDSLLRKQSQWIVQQNKQVRKYMKNPDTMEFPWRYTIGREGMWRKWGILEDTHQIKPIGSLRLTHPPSNPIKGEFKVKIQSTIL
jgi:hypothetical protein